MHAPLLHPDDYVAATVRCAMMMLLVICGGTLGFLLVEEHWSLWHSLYFTLITVTTVGYGDSGISPQGEVVAAILLLCGIGTFTFSLTTLMHIASDRQNAMRRKMNKLIGQCSNHFVICGYGRMGQAICRELADQGQTFLVIELDDANYARAVADKRIVIHGAASDDSILAQARIDQAAGVVCAVNSDAENMFITVSVRDLNKTCTIVARAESDAAARKMQRAGATKVVLPHQMAGESIARALVPQALEQATQPRVAGQQQLALCELIVEDHSELAGRPVSDVRELSDEVVAVAVETVSGEILLPPDEHYRFIPGDKVHLAGKPEKTARFCTLVTREPALAEDSA
jgi:voltage-gated potassium channel